MTQIKVLTGGMGQAVNPFEEIGDVSMGTKDWLDFNRANPPYHIINPGLAKEGEVIEAELRYQFLSLNKKWVLCTKQCAEYKVEFSANKTRQAFLIDDTPKEGEKANRDLYEQIEKDLAHISPSLTEAKPFDAVDDNRLIAEFMGWKEMSHTKSKNWMLSVVVDNVEYAQN